MDTSLIFESFIVFYLLEILFLISIAVWYYKKEQKHEPRPQRIEKTGPTTSQVMAMYKIVNKIKREQSVRK